MYPEIYLEIVDSIHKQVEGCLQFFLSIGCYSPEVRSFGTSAESQASLGLVVCVYQSI